MRGFFWTVGAFLAVTAPALPAHAEPFQELIPRLLDEGGWLRAHYPGEPSGQAERGPRAPTLVSSGSSGRSLFHHDPPADPTAALGFDPHVAVVARDWQQAFNLTDGRSLLFDRMRLIRSSRMVVARFILSGGRILPYIEGSFGQWRPDTDVVPWLRADLETASQVTFGVQAHLAPRCALAWDIEQTQIYFASNVPATHVVASFAAMRAEF